MPDVARARAFYRDVLGLSLQQETTDRLVFASAGWTLLVFHCDKGGRIGDYANGRR